MLLIKRLRIAERTKAPDRENNRCQNLRLREAYVLSEADSHRVCTLVYQRLLFDLASPQVEQIAKEEGGKVVWGNTDHRGLLTAINNTLLSLLNVIHLSLPVSATLSRFLFWVQCGWTRFPQNFTNTLKSETDSLSYRFLWGDLKENKNFDDVLL